MPRKIARPQGLKFTGTAGSLFRAKKKKYISEIAPLLHRLRDMGFYLSRGFINEILKISGEKSD